MLNKNERENLRILVLNLDDELGAIGSDNIMLQDISVLLFHLRAKMDNIDEKDVRLYFNELHREVRVLDEHSQLASDRLKKNHEAAEEIKEEIFKNTIN